MKEKTVSIVVVVIYLGMGDDDPDPDTRSLARTGDEKRLVFWCGGVVYRTRALALDRPTATKTEPLRLESSRVDEKRRHTSELRARSG